MDILDLAPSTEDVVLDGGTLTVRGLSNRTVFGLLDRFPALLLLLLGGGVDIPKAIVTTPDACLAIMAAGLGVAGDAQREAKLDALPLESQTAIIEAILRRTCPGGVGPFVSRIAAVLTPRDSRMEAAKDETDTGGELTSLAPPAPSSAPLN